MFVAGKKRKATGSQQSRPRLANPADTPAAQIQRFYKLGSENFRQRQYRIALDFFNRSIAIASNEKQHSAKLFEMRAHTYLKLRDFTRASDDAKQAIILDSNSAIGYAHLVSSLATTGKVDDALAVVNRGIKEVSSTANGYRYLETQRQSILKQLDPSYVPKGDQRSDPVARLPEDISVAVLRLLDLPTLLVCRRVSKIWRQVVDSAAVLWSDPLVVAHNAVSQLAAALPAYTKIQRVNAVRSNGRVPAKVLRLVLRLAKGSLVSVCVPDGSLLNPKVLEEIYACRRPLLQKIHIGKATGLTTVALAGLLRHVVPTNLVSVRLPYCPHVATDTMQVLASRVPHLRVLDISGCAQVRMKGFFKAWRNTLAGEESVPLQELYLNDHPGLPEFLVYSVRYRLFANLRILHMAVRDHTVYTMFSGLGPLIQYFHQLPEFGTPFPYLQELNIDGVWDATVSARRFESERLIMLVLRCKLLPAGCRHLSALDASAVPPTNIAVALRQCMASLRTLHITKAVNFGSSTMRMALGTVGDHLEITSLDLSGCVAISAAMLLDLVARCPGLVYVNLAQTCADNDVVAKLTEFVADQSSPGIQVLVLEATGVTGSGARDFVNACVRRYCDKTYMRGAWRLRLLDLDNCMAVGTDAVAVIRDMVTVMGTHFTAAIPN